MTTLNDDTSGRLGARPGAPATRRRAARCRGQASTTIDRFYRRPSWLRVKVVDPVLRALVLRAGLGRRGDQNVMRVLRVRGRSSGRSYDIPVRIAIWKGQRYVLSMLGESQWARNLRAAGAAHLLVGRRAAPVLAHEVRADEKAAFLTWYCQHPAYRLGARYALKADTANLTPTEVDRLARHYPVFRLTEPTGDTTRDQETNRELGTWQQL